eukprot:5685050-Amphidinium_carterae.1
MPLHAPRTGFEASFHVVFSSEQSQGCSREQQPGFCLSSPSAFTHRHNGSCVPGSAEGNPKIINAKNHTQALTCDKAAAHNFQDQKLCSRSTAIVPSVIRPKGRKPV